MEASVVLLGAVAIVALWLARDRSVTSDAGARLAAARALGLATAIQGAHFAEEAATGFHLRFPELLGATPWPFPLFALFNLAWLAIWGVSVAGLRAGRAGALFPAWFLALAGTLNGVAHPAMAIAAGGYFPGLLTSPLIGLAGVALWLRLRPPR